MTKNNWPKRSEMTAVFGNPDTNGDGFPDRAWEEKNLVIVECPWLLSLSWAPATKTRKMRVHRLVAPSLTRVLGVIWRGHGESQERIEQQRMNLFGGGYNFRVQRGAKTPILSNHAYGAAVDFDPERNPLGKRWKAGMISMDVVKAFEDEGWFWGGRFKDRPDCQHLEAVRS